MLRRDARAVVLDDELDAAVLERARAGADVRAGRRVADRVLDQVDRDALEVVGAAEQTRRLHVELDLVILGGGLELGGGRDHEVGEIRGLLARCGLLDVRAGEQQEVGDETAHALGRSQRRLSDLALLAVQRVLEQLEVREHARERRTQLVRGIGDERALARRARLPCARAHRRAR